MSAYEFDEQTLRIACSSKKEPYIRKKQIPGRGNGLVASGKSFTKLRETIIWIRRSLVLTIETSKLQVRCYQCLRSHTPDTDNQNPQTDRTDAVLKTCQGCQTVRYCGKKCQSRSWKECHKYECKIYSALHPRILPSPVRAVLRLLKQRANSLIDDRDWNSLLELESHQEDLSKVGGERWQDVFLMAKAVQKYSSTKEPMDLILRLCCILTVNSFTLTDPVLEPIGMALHPYPAMLNHSCDPNAVISFDTDPSHHMLQYTSSTDPILGSIALTLLLPVSSGTELTISYIDPTFPLAQRQFELSSRYFFICTCTRCNLGTTTPFDTLLKPTLFPNASTASSNAITLLNTCISHPTRLTSLIPQIRSALTSLAQTSTFPVHRHPYAPLRLQLILALISTGHWHEATQQSALLVYRIDPILYPQPHHPIRIVSKWRLYRLAHHLALSMHEGSMPPVDEGKEVMLKRTVVVSIRTLQFDEVEGTIEMPRSALVGLLSQADREVCCSELFEAAVRTYRLTPGRVEETLAQEWEAEIEGLLRREREGGGVD